MQALQSQGCLSYRSLIPEGPTGARRMAQLRPDMDTGRITYMRVRCSSFLRIAEIAHCIGCKPAELNPMRREANTAAIASHCGTSSSCNDSNDAEVVRRQSLKHSLLRWMQRQRTQL